MLPYVGFRVDHAHVGLICPAVDKNPVVHLEKSVLCIVLKRTVKTLGMCDLIATSGLPVNAVQWLRF